MDPSQIANCTQLSATSETFSYSDQSKVAIVILPLVTLEDQVEGEMTRLGLRYVNLTSTPAEALEEHIASVKPHVLIGNVESLTSTDIQRKISWLKISYIAVDEAQVKFFAEISYFYNMFPQRWPILSGVGVLGRTPQNFGAGCVPHTRESLSC